MFDVGFIMVLKYCIFNTLYGNGKGERNNLGLLLNINNNMRIQMQVIKFIGLQYSLNKRKKKYRYFTKGKQNEIILTKEYTNHAFTMEDHTLAMNSSVK